MVSTIANTNKYHVTSFSNEEYQVMLKLLNWPVSERFPVLDLLRYQVNSFSLKNILCRLQVLHPEAASYYGKISLISTILKFITDSVSTFPVIMMSLRFIANGMRNDAIRRTIVSKYKEVLYSSLGYDW